MESIRSPLQRRAARVLAGFFIAYGVLVATHLGEFWPFSIYPMFSTAGQPWTRSLVHELPEDLSEERLWQEAAPEDLPGDVLALADHGIFQNDLANYVAKTREWTPARVAGVQAMFRGRVEQDERVMIYRVRGVLQADGVAVTATPVMLLEGNEARLAPQVSATEANDE